MTMASVPENQRAKLYYVESNDEDKHGNPGPPKTDDKVHVFILDGEYKPGDVINFGEYRFSFAYMVVLREDTGRFRLVRNPDDSSSGYLTVPKEVLKYAGGDAIGKYKDVMDETSSVTFHFPNDDKFITDKLGPDIPDGWEFHAEFYAWDMLGSFWARPPGFARSKHSREFPYESLTMEFLQEAFKYHDLPHVDLKVSVSLSGDKLVEYKAKYGQEDDENAWMTAKPSLPATWILESGRSGGEDEDYTWSWTLTGPQKEEDDIKQRVGKFFLGFDFDIESTAVESDYDDYSASDSD